MSKIPSPIDTEADKADYDTAAKLIDAMSDRVSWIVYQTLYNLGRRIDSARREIEQRVPRKETKA